MSGKPLIEKRDKPERTAQALSRPGSRFLPHIADAEKRAAGDCRRLGIVPRGMLPKRVAAALHVDSTRKASRERSDYLNRRVYEAAGMEVAPVKPATQSALCMRALRAKGSQAKPAMLDPNMPGKR
jgi:hypothetical protein